MCEKMLRKIKNIIQTDEILKIIKINFLKVFIKSDKKL